MDKKNNLEIIIRELSTVTNFSGSEIKTEKELTEFAVNANFPSHGLILKKSKDDFENMVKGITHAEQLNHVFYNLINNFGTAYAESDMRAMYNPTRMKVIEGATVKLANKIGALCPNCDTPGFGITDSNPGLPCELCNFPTRSTLSYSYTCQKCDFKKEEKYPNGKKLENPMYCNICNP